MPVLPPTAPVRADVRLWVDGLLAGRYSRIGAARTGAGRSADTGPLVMWASQTGNAEDFAGRVADRLGAGAHLAT